MKTSLCSKRKTHHAKIISHDKQICAIIIQSFPLTINIYPHLYQEAENEKGSLYWHQ